jgi:Rha family phage regulatory protein
MQGTEIQARGKEFIEEVNGQPGTSSLSIAKAFGKRHDDVLKAVRNMECSEDFRRRNFAESSYINAQNKEQPMYRMTRDGFSVLIMGFTGPKAMEWKEKFLALFNAMEKELRKRQQPQRSGAEMVEMAEMHAMISDMWHRSKEDARAKRPAGAGIERSISPEVAVVQQQGIVGPGHRCLKERFYSVYRECCAAIGCLPSPMGVAMKGLYAAFPDLKPGRAKVEGAEKARPVINGLTIRKDDSE